MTDLTCQVGKKSGEVGLEPPLMYQVVMVNDDYTPMDFVISALSTFFNKDESEARSIMMQVHVQGQAVCGTYSKDVAESKVLQVVSVARQHGYPLTCYAQSTGC